MENQFDLPEDFKIFKDRFGKFMEEFPRVTLEKLAEQVKENPEQIEYIGTTTKQAENDKEVFHNVLSEIENGDFLAAFKKVHRQIKAAPYAGFLHVKYSDGTGAFIKDENNKLYL